MRVSCIIILRKGDILPEKRPENLPDIVTEIILIDDSGNELPEDTVKAFPADTYVFHQQPKGYAHCANAALAIASEDLCLFLHPNLTPVEGAVTRMAEYLSSSGREGIVCGGINTPTGEKIPAARRYPGFFNAFIRASGLAAAFPKSFVNCLEFGLKRFPYPTEIPWANFDFAMMHKSLVQQLGQFDARFFTPLAGADMCMRAKKSLVPALSVTVFSNAKSIKPLKEGISAFCLPEEKPEEIAADTVYFLTKKHGPLYGGAAGISALCGGLCHYAASFVPKFGKKIHRKKALQFLVSTMDALKKTCFGTRPR